MDYHIFLVRPLGTSAGGRPSKGTSRMLSVLQHGISLSHALTENGVPHTEYSFESISNVMPSNDDEFEFKFDVSHPGGRTETLRFACDCRSMLLTALLNKLDDVESSGIDFPVKKHSHQRGGLADAMLRVRCASIVKMMSTRLRQERRKANHSKKMNFVDILRMEVLSDDEHVVLLYFKSRILRLSLKDTSPFVQLLQQNMKRFLNRDIEVSKIPSSALVENISEFMGKVDTSQVVYNFEVIKRLDARREERHRTLSITKKHMIERSGDEVMALYSLKDILGLVAKEDDPRELVLELRSWRPTQYIIEGRGNFIASIVDVMESVGLHSFRVQLDTFTPYLFPERSHTVYQIEYELFYASRIVAIMESNDQARLHILLKEYACNVNVGDFICSDPKLVGKLADILKSSIGNPNLATCCCIVFQRVLGSRPCFDVVKSMPELGSIFMQCVCANNSVLSYMGTVCIRAAMKLASEASYIDSSVLAKMEAANKASILNTENMQHLVSILQAFVPSPENSLQIYGIVQTLLLAMSCSMYENKAGLAWQKAFESCIGGIAKVLCKLFRVPWAVVYYSNSILLKTILTLASPSLVAQTQRVCLDQCLLLVHLKDALFAVNEKMQSVSQELVYLMIEGNSDSRELLKALLPQGIMNMYAARVADISLKDKDKTKNRFLAWVDIIRILCTGHFVTPTLMWNDAMRIELKKFLTDEIDAFYAAADNNKDLIYNSSEVQLLYSAATGGAGSCIDGVYLELLVDNYPESEDPRLHFWKLQEPSSTFGTIFQAMVLVFTPFLGANNNIPEIDMRLAATALNWIYEHYPEVRVTVGKLNVIEIVVGMLRELIGTDELPVFVFKLVVFLLSAVEIGGKENALRFLRAGGATVIVPLIVLCLGRCCKDKLAFECDGWDMKDQRFARLHETVLVKHSNGQVKTVRVPSGRYHELLDKAVKDGSLDAKEGIHWQDDTVHDKLQLGLALDLLEAILRLSGVESNVEYFPPSAASHHLSKEELLCHLVQVLLWAKGSVFGRILDILSYVVKVNSTAMNRLYKLGAFEIILWKLLAGDLLESDRAYIVGFIRQSHLLQDPGSIFDGPEFLSDDNEQFTWRSSILRLFLPEGVILKLMSESLDAFTSLLNSDIDNPEVIWNSQMKERLLDFLKVELEPFVKFRASDSLALYIHIPKAPVLYPELAESVFCAPFYLENLLDTDRFANYQIDDPVTFLNSLIQDVKKCMATLVNSGSTTFSGPFWRKESTRIHLLLRAQAYLVQRFPEIALSAEVESIVSTLAMPALRTCLAQKDEPPFVPIDILVQVITILKHHSKFFAKDMEVPQASLNFALSALSLGINHGKNGEFPAIDENFSFESVVGGSLLLLATLLSSRAVKDMCRDDIRWRKGFWWALTLAVRDATTEPPGGPTPISFAALTCFKCFAEDDIYFDWIFKQGWYLPLLLLVIPSTDSAVKECDSISALLYSSVDVLQCLMRTLHRAKTSQDAGGLSMAQLMESILPRPLLTCLLQSDGPEKFITASLLEIMHPEGIWTCTMRMELLQQVHERLLQRSNALMAGNLPLNDDIEWIQSFKYRCLEGEILVDGLFVRGLGGTSWDGFHLPLGHSYIDTLQEHIKLYKSDLLLSTVLEEESGEMFEEIMETGEMVEELVETEDFTMNGKDAGNGVEERNVSRSVPGVDTRCMCHVSISQEAKSCLCALAALRECLKYAAKEGRDDIIHVFQHSIVSDVVLSGRSIPEVQIEVSIIMKALAECHAGQNILLKSKLLNALTLQMWNSASKVSKEEDSQIIMSTLEAALVLSENIPATVQATDFFAMCGMLVPLLAIFLKINTPSLTHSSSLDDTDMASSTPICKTSQLLAAQILGQLLLAGSGISRRAKLVKDLSFWRKSMNPRDYRTYSRDSLHDATVEGIQEATDMYELLNIVEQDSVEKMEALVLRTMLLLFPIDFLTLLAREPSKACDLYEGHRWSPCLVWDEGTRLCLTSMIEKEMLLLRDKFINEGLAVIPSWYMTGTKPVFLRWTLATIVDNDPRPLYKDVEDVDYCQELYLGGFFIDQFLRNPEYDFGIQLENRFLREVRKAVVVGVRTRRANAEDFDFDDRRRLLLCLLLLFKLRPLLLQRTSNFDIFFPVYDFISGGSSRARRGLMQVAIVLFHCINTHSDVADCMSSEDLMNMLSSLLDLKVPASVAGFAGTDPRLCSLGLMLRLARLSSTTVEVALQLGIVHKLVVLLNMEGDPVLQQHAAECLAVMCADKRRGSEVLQLLESLIAKGKKSFGMWNLEIADIRDEVVDSKTLKHFLQQRYPSSWWVSESSDSFGDTDTDMSGPVTIVEASLTFPGGNLMDINCAMIM